MTRRKLERLLLGIEKQFKELKEPWACTWIEGVDAERQWRAKTRKLLVKVFGELADEVRAFDRARWAGKYAMGGSSGTQARKNQQLRSVEYQMVLESCIEKMRKMLSEV
jgi:hypothetical protein